jgi:hypothetical protein
MTKAELTPPAEAAAVPLPAPASIDALTREIKKELERLGCYAGPIDDDWPTRDIESAIRKFAAATHASVPADRPSPDLLWALRGKAERVCPIECRRGEVEANGICVAKTCAPGSILDENGDCVRRPHKERAEKEHDHRAGKHPGEKRRARQARHRDEEGPSRSHRKAQDEHSAPSHRRHEARPGHRHEARSGSHGAGGGGRHICLQPALCGN